MLDAQKREYVFCYRMSIFNSNPPFRAYPRYKVLPLLDHLVFRTTVVQFAVPLGGGIGIGTTILPQGAQSGTFRHDSIALFTNGFLAGYAFQTATYLIYSHGTPRTELITVYTRI